MKKKVLAFSGSLRSDSYNLKLVRAFAKLMEQDGNYECQILSAKDLQMPLLNEELDMNQLPEVLKFRAALKEAQIVVIGSPEYNGGYTPALKNAIDWATRPPENLWIDKVAVLTAASPGGFAGVRGLLQVRSILSGIKCWVVPEQVLCGAAHEAFNADGTLKNEAVVKQMQASLAALSTFSNKFHR